MRRPVILAVLMPLLGAPASGAPSPDTTHYRRAPQVQVLRPAERALPAAAICLGGCFSLEWTQLADVIGVTVGNDGVEGATGGIDGDTIYVSHGYSFGDNAAMRIYDIPSDTWSFGASGSVLRSEGGGAFVLGMHYSIGGRTTLADVEIYDPASDLWSTGTPMPTARSQFGIAVIADRIHVIGGSTGGGPQSGSPLATHEVYDPATDTWASAPPLPDRRSDISAVVAVGPRIYVMGGWDGLSERAETYIYDTVASSWSSGAPMPTARSNAAAGQLAGCPIVIGGLAFGGNLTVVEIYDPVSDTWCGGPDKPSASSEHATMAPFTADTIYAIGSGAFGASLPPHEALVLSTADVTAAAPPDVAICSGDTVTLDASASSGCAGSSIEYRWLDGVTPICGWSAVPTCDVTPPVSTTYTLETRCLDAPDCVSRDTTTVEVVPDPIPAAGADVSVCELTPLTLDASGSTDVGCPAGLLFEWRQGATVVRPAAPDPTWQPPTMTAGTTVYTVVVSCAGSPGCAAADDVSVEVRACPLAVRFDVYRVVAQADGTSRITWSTLEESGTLGFVVERAPAASGQFVALGEAEAHGPGHPYVVRDEQPGAASAFYRIVEITMQGAGDATPAFTSTYGEGARSRARRQPAAVESRGGSRRRVESSP